MVCPEDKIKCIFFCQFHPKEGPKIEIQYPDKYVEQEEFHCIQNYLIPKEELQQKLITVKTTRHKIVGCPVHIDGERYERYYYIFNICFVFDCQANTSSYEKVLKKLVHYFTVLEREINYLSNRHLAKPSLGSVLEQVLYQLNSKGSCNIPIDEANTVHLKLLPSFTAPGIVRDYDVPVLTFKLHEYHRYQWDLATQQILPYINGFKHILQIAMEAMIDTCLVKALVQNLLYFQLVEIIPIFQYSNIYVITLDIQKLYTSHDLQNRCMKAVALAGKSLPTFDDILKLYSCFTHGAMTTVKQVCVRYRPKKLHIDIRELIKFGVVNKFIRRIHQYPISVAGTTSSSESAGARQYLKYCDGLHSYDEICCSLGMSYEELDSMIEADPDILICWK